MKKPLFLSAGNIIESEHFTSANRTVEVKTPPQFEGSQLQPPQFKGVDPVWQDP